MALAVPYRMVHRTSAVTPTARHGIARTHDGWRVTHYATEAFAADN